MAQLVIGVAGAVAGGILGGPVGAQIGFALGSAVGASLTTQRTYGPRLTDLKVPQSSYGSVIPYVEGSVRTAGVWVWTSDKREVASTSSTGGKGGPTIENTSYTYFIDALILLSEDEIAGVRRVWSNGKLIWSAVEDATLETLLASEETTSWDAMRVYTGTSTQMPDSVYEAAVGTANAPGYRGKGYVFIENMALGSSGQIPALTFEVYRGQQREIGEIQPSPVEQSKPGSVGGGAAAFVANGVLQVALPQWTSAYDTTLVNVYELDVLNGTSTVVGSYNVVSQYTNPASTGSSDVPVYVQMQGSTVLAYFGATGVRYTYTMPDNLAFEGVFACAGDDIVFAGRMSVGKKIYRYHKTGGTVQAVSASLDAGPTSMVIIGGYVYAAGYDSETVYKLDLETLTLQATLQTPLYGLHSDSIPMLCNLDGELCLSSSAVPSGNTYPVYAYRGGAWVQIGNLESNFGQGQYNSPSLIVAGSVIVGGRITDSPPYKYRVKYATLLGDRVDPALADIVARQCQRAGLTSSMYDVSGLSGTVKGFAVSQLSSPRQVLEMLGTAYTFLTVESSGKLKFRPRGGASVATVSYGDLGASASSRVEPLPFVRVNDLEVPAQVVVKFANWDNDHQDGAEVADRLLSSLAGAVETIELPLAMTATEARRVAEIRTAEITGSALRVEGLAVDRRLARLEPGDAITVMDQDGVSAYRVVILRVRDAGMVRQIDGVLEDASVTTSNAVTDTNYDTSGQLLRRAETVLRLLDIPILADADDDTGHYAAAARAGNSGSWPGAYLMRGENNADYAQVATFSSRTYIGTTTGTLGAFDGGRVFDELNTLVVTGSGELESYTRENVLNGSARPLLVGQEVLFYREATMTGAGAYTVRGLLRGMRGTEWAIDTHTASETVVLLQAGGLQRVQTPTAKLGVEMDFKGVTNGAAADTVDPTAFTNTAVGRRPFSPVDARFERVGGGVQVTWKRRTRYAVGFTGASGASAPLGEATEAYEVDVLQGSPPAVVATIASSTPSANLSTAASSLTLAVGAERLVRRTDGSVVGLEWSDPSFIVACNADGSFDERSYYLGSDVQEIAASGTALYVAVRQVDGSGAWVSAKLRSLPIGVITAPLENPPAASQTAATAGDYGGVVWDGSNPWTVGSITGYLRKHNASTLSVEASILVQPPVAPYTEAYLRHVAHMPAAGLLYTMCAGGPAAGAVIAVDPTGSPTERWRVTVAGAGLATSNPPLQVIGSTLLVPTDGGWSLLNAHTGSVIASSSAGEQVPPRAAVSSTEFVVRKSSAEAHVALVRSTVDGSLVRTVTGIGTGAIIGAFEGNVIQKRTTTAGTYVLGDIDVVTGDVVRIYQLSDTYGRGLPLEAAVPSL